MKEDNEKMRRRNSGRLYLWLLMMVGFLCLPGLGSGASPEMRPAAQMVGTIIAPQEERKLALAAGDKVFIALDKERSVRKGEVMEIYQPAPLISEGKADFHYVRTGELVVLEQVNDRLLLAVIERSTREIAVGDRIFIADRP
jgi:hypothetical protein